MTVKRWNILLLCFLFILITVHGYKMKQSMIIKGERFIESASNDPDYYFFATYGSQFLYPSPVNVCFHLWHKGDGDIYQYYICMDTDGRPLDESNYKVE